jgi:hypothetical protein
VTRLNVVVIVRRNHVKQAHALEHMQQTCKVRVRISARDRVRDKGEGHPVGSASRLHPSMMMCCYLDGTMSRSGLGQGYLGDMTETERKERK